MGVFHNVLYTMGFERVKITPVKDVRLVYPLPSRMDDIELKWTKMDLNGLILDFKMRRARPSAF